MTDFRLSPEQRVAITGFGIFAVYQVDEAAKTSGMSSSCRLRIR